MVRPQPRALRGVGPLLPLSRAFKPSPAANKIQPRRIARHGDLGKALKPTDPKNIRSQNLPANPDMVRLLLPKRSRDREGVVTNLSRSGMRMLGDHALKAGTDLCVRFQLEEDQPPIEITRATVRWVREYEFGLRIDDQTAAAAGRIAEVLNRQARTGLNGW